MKVNFLTTAVSDLSGGATYDMNFLRILKSLETDVTVLDDAHFLSKNLSKAGSLWDFNVLYDDYADEIFDCDILFTNSRLYTRFIKMDFAKIRKRFPRMKLVTIHHHSNYMNHSGLLHLVHKHFEMNMLGQSDNLIIPNKYIVDTLGNRGISDNVIYLPSSFDRMPVTPSSLSGKNLLFVGTVERRKGILLALKAVAPLMKDDPDITFRIAGSFNENDRYSQKLIRFIYAQRLDNRIIIEGRVESERLEELYSSSDLFVFPSQLEGYGWVMIEAMSHGLPVIAFDNSAMPYTVKNDYNGYLVRNKDWRSMSKIIRDTLVDKDKMIKLSKGAIETFNATPTKMFLEDQTRHYLMHILEK